MLGYTARLPRRAEAPWRERKERYLAHLQEADAGALRIALADKLHNAHQLVADYRVLREALWERFNAGKDDQLWLYRSMVIAVKESEASRRVSSARIEEFETVVRQLEGLAA